MKIVSQIVYPLSVLRDTSWSECLRCKRQLSTLSNHYTIYSHETVYDDRGSYHLVIICVED